MTTPLVSVLIDTYNYGRFVEQAVESVLTQDYPPERMELILVDDGSTDDTPERVAKYLEGSPGRAPVQYLRKENGGQASAFNCGIGRATGDLVAFLDADDYWLPGKLARVVEEFDRHPDAGLVYHRLLERTESTGQMSKALFVDVSGDVARDANALRHYRAYPTSSLVFRRDLLETFLPIPEEIRLQTDAYIGLLAALAAPIRAIPDCLAVYRLHGTNLFAGGPASLTRERRQSQIDMLRSILGGVNSWIGEHGIDPQSPAVHALLERHYLYCQDMGFGLEPPGRWQFFRFQLRKNRLNRDVCGMKLRAINSFNAIASLATGYEGFGGLERWWLRLDQMKDRMFPVRQ